MNLPTPKLMVCDRQEPHGVVTCKGFTAQDTVALMQMYAQAVEDNRDDPENDEVRERCDIIRKAMKEWCE